MLRVHIGHYTNCPLRIKISHHFSLLCQQIQNLSRGKVNEMFDVQLNSRKLSLWKEQRIMLLFSHVFRKCLVFADLSYFFPTSMDSLILQYHLGIHKCNSNLALAIQSQKRPHRLRPESLKTALTSDASQKWGSQATHNSAGTTINSGILIISLISVSDFQHSSQNSRKHLTTIASVL